MSLICSCPCHSQLMMWRHPSASGSYNKASGNAPLKYGEIYCGDSVGAQCLPGIPQAWQGLPLVYINSWHMVDAIDEKKLLYGETRTDRQRTG